eukprot:2480120-Prymnesium_polylepis.1
MRTCAARCSRRVPIGPPQSGAPEPRCVSCTVPLEAPPATSVQSVISTERTRLPSGLIREQPR